MPAAFLFIIFALFVAIAPFKITIIFCIVAVLVTLTIKASTQAIASFTPSIGSIIKSVGFSFLFLGLALVTLISFSINTGITQFSGISAIALLAIFLLHTHLVFMLGLEQLSALAL
jgi:hypothetical protein